MPIYITTGKENSKPSKNPALFTEHSKNQHKHQPQCPCPLTQFLHPHHLSEYCNPTSSHSYVSHLHIIFLSCNRDQGRLGSVIKTMMASGLYQLRKLHQWLTLSTITYSNPILQRWFLGFRREGVADLLRFLGCLERKSGIIHPYTCCGKCHKTGRRLDLQIGGPCKAERHIKKMLRTNLEIQESPYPWEACPKTPSGCLKPQIVPNFIYTFFIYIHTYDKV